MGSQVDRRGAVASIVHLPGWMPPVEVISPLIQRTWIGEILASKFIVVIHVTGITRRPSSITTGGTMFR